jgi:hypothetical protein
MADMLLRQIGLVSESKRVKPSQLTKVSAALQKQATRDLVQFWNVKATVDAFARLEDLPICTQTPGGRKRGSAGTSRNSGALGS